MVPPRSKWSSELPGLSFWWRDWRSSWRPAEGHSDGAIDLSGRLQGGGNMSSHQCLKDEQIAWLNKRCTNNKMDRFILKELLMTEIMNINAHLLASLPKSGRRGHWRACSESRLSACRISSHCWCRPGWWSPRSEPWKTPWWSWLVLIS